LLIIHQPITLYTEFRIESSLVFPMISLHLVFKKSAEKIQVSLKSDKNNGYFSWSPIYINYNISLITS